ncbi:MAG: hypothetical protein JSV00_09670 [bacterium]|nr:MAG: hypothetical protein JSV00_09670 [bacterium]
MGERAGREAAADEADGRVEDVEKSSANISQNHAIEIAISVPPGFLDARDAETRRLENRKIAPGSLKKSRRNPCLWFGGWQVYNSGQVG